MDGVITALVTNSGFLVGSLRASRTSTLRRTSLPSRTSTNSLRGIVWRVSWSGSRRPPASRAFKSILCAIASAAAYGVSLGLGWIDSAISMSVVRHFPFRAIHADKQLFHPKGTSVAISMGAAVLSISTPWAASLVPRTSSGSQKRPLEFSSRVWAWLRARTMSTLSLATSCGGGPAPGPLNLALSYSSFAMVGVHFKLGLQVPAGGSFRWCDHDPCKQSRS